MLYWIWVESDMGMNVQFLDWVWNKATINLAVLPRFHLESLLYMLSTYSILLSNKPYSFYPRDVLQILLSPLTVT